MPTGRYIFRADLVIHNLSVAWTYYLSNVFFVVSGKIRQDFKEYICGAVHVCPECGLQFILIVMNILFRLNQH